MPGRNFAPLAALTLLLALGGQAGIASAATYEVDPKAGAGCSGTTCQTIEAALDKVAPGDKVSIKRGVYQESPLNVTDDNVTIEAVPGQVAITSKSTASGADVLKISANGVTLRGLTIGVQPGGGSAVTISGTGALVDTSTLVNQSAGGADVATLEVLAPSGTTTVRDAIVVHTPDLAATGGAPAILGPAASTLLVEGSQAVAGPESASAISLTGPSGRIVRSGLVALNANADALLVTSASDSATDKAVTVDSSVLAGGANAAGLHARSIGGGIPSGSTAGDIAVSLTHATIAGSVRSIVIDAQGDSFGLGASPQGSISVSAARSIVHGAAVVSNFDGTLGGLLGPANSATLDITESDTDVQPSSESGSTVTVSGASNTPDSALFADPVKRIYLLRPDAPVRDKGGAVRAGEGDKDIENESRIEGPATDLGADEFHNKLPQAKLALPAQVAQNQSVTLDASGSRDPEATYGGGLKEYRFDFGDGTSEVTTSPKVQHAYGALGTYQPKVTVVDNFGAVSAVAQATLQVTDGIAPVVRIAQPKHKGTFALRTKTGEIRTFRFQGTASDESGVDFVDVSLSFGKATGRTCRFLDAKKNQIVGRPCRKPIFFRIAMRDGIWAYRTKATTKLRVGSYLLTVRATDKSGVQGVERLRFRLK